MTYALAGHPAILHFDRFGNPRHELSDEQFPLGLIAGTSFRSHTMEAVSGDLLVAATDGIFETCSQEGVEFGAAGVKRVVADNPTDPLPTLADKIMARVAAAGVQDDDRTLLLVRIR